MQLTLLSFRPEGGTRRAEAEIVPAAYRISSLGKHGTHEVPVHALNHDTITRSPHSSFCLWTLSIVPPTP